MKGTLQLTGNRWCITCGSGRATKICGGCKVTRYCSHHCRREHWPHHRHICNNLVPVPSQLDTSLGYLVIADGEFLSAEEIINSIQELSCYHRDNFVKFVQRIYEWGMSTYHVLEFDVGRTDTVLSIAAQLDLGMPFNNHYMYCIDAHNCPHGCTIHFGAINRYEPPARVIPNNVKDWSHRQILFITTLLLNRLEVMYGICIPNEIRGYIAQYCYEWVLCIPTRHKLFPIGGLDNVWILSKKL